MSVGNIGLLKLIHRRKVTGQCGADRLAETWRIHTRHFLLILSQSKTQRKTSLPEISNSQLRSVPKPMAIRSLARGRVFVGTNNGAEYRPRHSGDRGCVLAFDEMTGQFMWQLTREKLEEAKVNDWPEQGICSTPCVDGDRMWLVTNRAELICLDTEGFYDGENNGPYRDEVDRQKQDADIIWILDMIDELGVFPHNLATSSPIVYGDLVFLLTSNGVDEFHKEVVLPRAPSFIAVNKRTGKLVWESRIPGDRILHGQWSSPTIGIVNGHTHVFFGGGDGWVYALEAETGKLVWKCDLNPKDSIWRLYGRGTRNNIRQHSSLFRQQRGHRSRPGSGSRITASDISIASMQRKWAMSVRHWWSTRITSQ